MLAWQMTSWGSNLCDLLKILHSIGTHTLLLDPIMAREQIESEFLNHCYSTHRIASILELTDTRQWNNELVIDYINPWHAPSLKCKDCLCKSLAIKICAQGIDRDILCALHVNKPKIFQKLIKRAHEMELTIAYSGRGPTNDESTRSSRKRSSMLNGFKGNKCPSFEFDAPRILDKLLEKRLIELPKPKNPEEMRRSNDSKYCKCHGIIGHPTEKCKVFKKQVMQLRKEGKILFDKEDTKECN